MGMIIQIPTKPKDGIYSDSSIWDAYMDLVIAIEKFPEGRVSGSVVGAKAKMKAKAKRIEYLAKALVAVTNYK